VTGKLEGLPDIFEGLCDWTASDVVGMTEKEVVGEREGSRDDTTVLDGAFETESLIVGLLDKLPVGLLDTFIDGLSLGKLNADGDSVRNVGILLPARCDGD